MERWLSWSKAHDWKSCSAGMYSRVRIPFSPPNKTDTHKGVCFVFGIKRGRDSKGAARSEAGEKPSSEWFFSTPGWRRHWPSAGGNPFLSAKHKRHSSKCLLCFWIREEGILLSDFWINADSLSPAHMMISRATLWDQKYITVVGMHHAPFRQSLYSPNRFLREHQAIPKQIRMKAAREATIAINRALGSGAERTVYRRFYV